MRKHQAHNKRPNDTPEPTQAGLHFWSECPGSRQCNKTWPVDELVDDDDVSGLNLLTQGAAGRGDQQMCAALLPEGPDVGLVVHIGRHDSVLPSMSENGQETLFQTNVDHIKTNTGFNFIPQTLDGAIILIQTAVNMILLTLQEVHTPRFLSSPIWEHQTAGQHSRMLQLYTKESQGCWTWTFTK